MAQSITITTNLADVTAQLDAVARTQVPFATALALTRLAGYAKQATIAEMRQVLDRPKPWTLNSLMLRKATKSNLEASVWFKEFAGKGIPASQYMPWQVYGGMRPHKRFEAALYHRGYLGRDERTIPGAGAKLDAYGNISSGQITRMLSQLLAFTEVGYTANARQGAKTRYFATDGRNHLKRGVYYRKTERSLSPFLIFTRQQTYKQRLDFFGVSEQSVAGRYDAEFGKALSYALATARR